MPPAASRSIKIPKIYLGLAGFYTTIIFNALLNYIQYKLAFTHNIDMYKLCT